MKMSSIWLCCFLRNKEFSEEDGHENISDGRRERCTHSSAFVLLKSKITKLKIAVVDTKV